jgi:hypothetical protein
MDGLTAQPVLGCHCQPIIVPLAVRLEERAHVMLEESEAKLNNKCIVPIASGKIKSWVKGGRLFAYIVSPPLVDSP